MVEMWPLTKLRPCEHSLRKNDHAVEAVAAMIKEFGFRVPILARGNGEIIDGHLRYKAANHAGLTEVPVLLADDMTERQIRAFRIAVNKAATLAKWDMGLLRAELAALADDDFDLLLTGFSESELDDLRLGSESGNQDPDAVPDPPSEPVSRNGDLWCLGKHRLLCGDGTSIESYTTLFGDAQADLLVTDPPYGVFYESKAGTIKNDDLAGKELLAFLSALLGSAVSYLRPGGGAYVFHADAGEIGTFFRQAWLGAGLKLAACLIWRKNNARLGRADYHWQHEPILYGWRIGAAHRWYGGRKKKTVMELDDLDLVSVMPDGDLQIMAGEQVIVVSGDNLRWEVAAGSLLHCDMPTKNDVHPTMKPVALLERLLVNSSRAGDLVLDCCLGSGSTMIACERRRRSCYGVELDPRFCDVIINRWQGFTGQEALLAESCRTFADVAQERR